MPINSFLYPAKNVPGAYEVANSLRFNKGSSDYLNRTFGTSTSTKKCTYSCWVKRSKLNDSGGQYLFTFNNTGSAIYFNGSGTGAGTNDELVINSDSNFAFYTDDLYRDVSAWYHIVVAVDTTQGTASNRVKIYVNNVQVTNFGTETYPSQNADFNNLFSSSGVHEIGRGAATGGTEYFGGYMAEVVFIDGQQLDPTSFGEFDSDTGIWKPIDVSDLTFGNNGFYLDFENSGSLGADVSGNGNNFTVSNLTSVDQSTDTCTNNFCTLNPLASGGNPTFSEGNLKLYRASGDGTSQKTTFSTIAASSGKWYAEVKIDSVGSNGLIIGFVNVDKSNLPNTSLGTGEDDFSAGIYSNGGPIFYSSGTTFATVGSYSADDILQLAMDIDNGYLYWGKNGTYLNSGDPTSGSSGTGGLALSNLTSGGTYTFAIAIRNNATIQMNYGSPPFSISSGNSDANGYGNFEYAVPSGYYSLCTKNLAEYG